MTRGHPHPGLPDADRGPRLPGALDRSIRRALHHHDGPQGSVRVRSVVRAATLPGLPQNSDYKLPSSMQRNGGAIPPPAEGQPPSPPDAFVDRRPPARSSGHPLHHQEGPSNLASGARLRLFCPAPGRILRPQPNGRIRPRLLRSGAQALDGEGSADPPSARHATCLHPGGAPVCHARVRAAGQSPLPARRSIRRTVSRRSPHGEDHHHPATSTRRRHHHRPVQARLHGRPADSAWSCVTGPVYISTAASLRGPPCNSRTDCRGLCPGSSPAPAGLHSANPVRPRRASTRKVSPGHLRDLSREGVM